MTGVLRGCVLLILALSLSGCIGSSFDIARQLPPTQPIDEGTYKNDEGEVYSVKMDGKNYKITKDKDTVKMALFASPENSKFYFVQFLGVGPSVKDYGYAFASAGNEDNSFIIYDLDKADVWLLPEELRKLAPFNGDVFEVEDPERDTLHILREAVRLGIPLDPQVKKTVYRLVKP